MAAPAEHYLLLLEHVCFSKDFHRIHMPSVFLLNEPHLEGHKSTARSSSHYQAEDLYFQHWGSDPGLHNYYLH